MTRLQWDQVSERFYEFGVDHGVLYLDNDLVVPWNGLTAVEEDFSDLINTPYFVDGVKYLDVSSHGDFTATLSAITFPDEFLDYEGVDEIGNGLFVDAQNAKPFGLAYRTKISNDSGVEAYKLHICYNLLAVPNDKSYQTVSDQITPIAFSWKLSGIPEPAVGYRATAHVILDSRYIYTQLLPELEDTLYGSDTTEPSLPALSDLIQTVTSWSLIKITVNGDGTWTATGPDEYITMIDSTTFMITNVDATYSDADTYTIRDTYEPQIIIGGPLLEEPLPDIF